jgi:hypothetical protein
MPAFRRLYWAGYYLGIKVIDHVIIGHDRYVCFLEVDCCEFPGQCAARRRPQSAHIPKRDFQAGFDALSAGESQKGISGLEVEAGRQHIPKRECITS